MQPTSAPMMIIKTEYELSDVYVANKSLERTTDIQ